MPSDLYILDYPVYCTKAVATVTMTPNSVDMPNNARAKITFHFIVSLTSSLFRGSLVNISLSPMYIIVTIMPTVPITIHSEYQSAAKPVKTFRPESSASSTFPIPK